LTSLTDTPLLNTMHNSSRRDKGQLEVLYVYESVRKQPGLIERP